MFPTNPLLVTLKHKQAISYDKEATDIVRTGIERVVELNERFCS